MGFPSEAIDLTQSPPPLPPLATRKGKARLTAAPVDLTSDSEDTADVRQPGHAQQDKCCCSSACLPHLSAAVDSSIAAAAPPAATAGNSCRSKCQNEACRSNAQLPTSEVAVCTQGAEHPSHAATAGPSQRKRKRVAEQDKEQAQQDKEQAKQKRLQDKADQAAAKAAEKAAKKGAEPKRTNAEGKRIVYSARPNQKTRERMARAMPNSGHRLFLLDRKMTVPMTHENGPQETFNVLGATANVYTVTVAKHPCCTCPDFQKGNLCKHYLFIMLRVLRLPRNDPLVWQRALLKTEAEQVLGGTRSSRADAEVLADSSVLTHYRHMTGNDVATSSSSAAGPGGAATKQRPVEGECAICYDTLQADSSQAADAVTFCQGCGNNVHVECFKRWTASKRSSGEPVTCVYCRCPWQDAAAAAVQEQDYVNLHDISQVHQRADISLETLYGETAVWIHANNGRMGRRQAANLSRLNRAA